MKKEAAEIWISALRSGEFKQGKMFLEHSNLYCPLGVLAMIAVVNGITDYKYCKNIGVFGGEICTLSEDVIEWAGLNSDVGEVKGLKNTIVDMNDKGMTFVDIANCIERHWKDL